jgi:hypothetical protein
LKTKKVFLMGLVALLLASLACSVSSILPTAVPEPTYTPQPTYTLQPTYTPYPTLVPTPVQTPTLSLLPGVDDYVFFDGINMRVTGAYFLEFLGGTEGDIYPDNRVDNTFLVVDFQAFGSMDVIPNWNNEPNVNRMMRVRDDQGNIIAWLYDAWNADEGWISFVFEVPRTATTFMLIFPDDAATTVDLEHFLE